MTIIEQIELAKKLNKSNNEIHSLFIEYCYHKGIGIYSRETYTEILKLFPKSENEKLYNYCIWMLENQVD